MMEMMDQYYYYYYVHIILLCVTSIVDFAAIVNAVNAGCECIVYEDTFGKEYGVFTSPNWPAKYDSSIDCLLYSFLARADQIVEITFDEFDVQKTNLDCVFGDFVKLFLHLDDHGVNEDSEWNSILCGKIADIEQTHYSSSSNLIFEFHADWRHANNTGFRGTYRFLNKQLFHTDGDLMPKTKCDYKFISFPVHNGSIVRSRGRFFSPQYPSTYPKNVHCSYYFIGYQYERVKLVFERVRLHKSDLSCINSPDVILAHDGKDSTSPVIGQLCNINSFVELVSTGPNLYIEFSSRSHFPGQGFKAKYMFESTGNAISINAGDIPSTEPDNPGVKKVKVITVTTDPAYECDQWISSDTAKNGTFTSPNYPDPYPANVHCTYHFNGRGKERVQISFTHFDLNKIPETNRECESADVIMGFITINGQKERIDNFCGNELPPQMMSNGPTMSIEFKSLHFSHHVKGFRGVYRFVTNFGITSGNQDSQSVCGFVFNSTDKNNGTFTSPNYPGLYPRDTECHYFFYGNGSERVHITFAYFDLEGVTPCTTETASDYLEFSNYRTVDRKIPRHCGLKKPKVIESDGNFFRVTFKSNDRFDGNGFKAFYQFKSQDDASTVTIQRGISGCEQCVAHLSLMMSLIVITVLFKNVIVSQQINHILYSQVKN